MSKILIRKVRPSDIGDEPVDGCRFPWLVFFSECQAHAFRTWDLAIRYAIKVSKG